jgi:hypothetical protein
MGKLTRFSPEVRDLAVRLVHEQTPEHPSVRLSSRRGRRSAADLTSVSDIDMGHAVAPGASA